jgi:NTE family protein
VLVAAGRPASWIVQQALELQPWDLLRVSVGGEQRWTASALADWVDDAVGGRRLEQLPLPVVCVVQRLRDGSVLGFNRGRAGLAVQAACAVEGRLQPVRIRGELHADADLKVPLPVRLARSLGAQRVLAVDASAHEQKAPPGSERYRPSDLRKRALTQPDAAAADVLLHPEFGYWVSVTREFRQQAIDAGHEAVLAAAPALRGLRAG